MTSMLKKDSFFTFSHIVSTVQKDDFPVSTPHFCFPLCFLRRLYSWAKASY